MRISGEGKIGIALEGQLRNAANLCAVVNAALILAPCAFLGVLQKVRAGNVMMMANLSSADAAEIAFRHIRASAVHRIRFLMVDAAHLEF